MEKPTEKKILLDCRDVSLGYEGQALWQGLTFQVRSGDYLCVVGENGSGKSTLLKSMLGLLKPMKGEIVLDRSLRAGAIGYLPQQTQAQKDFPATVTEVVRSGFLNGRGAHFFYTAQEKSTALMHMGKLGILELKDRCYRELSGGQQQRVALARAIVIRPQVLLMDEPLSNLDAKLRIEMRNAIKQIQRRVDITTVYVTHDQEEALAVSDRIAVMNGGVICQIGKPADIYKRPKNVFVSTFIGLSNLLDGHIVKKGDKTSISFKENEDWLVDMDNLSGGVEDGEEVIISVRPEEFDMEPGMKEGIHGVIRSSVFLGLTTHYFITTDGGQELEILQTQEGHDILPDGSAVTLTVKAGRINVFRRATEETLIREEGL